MNYIHLMRNFILYLLLQAILYSLYSFIFILLFIYIHYIHNILYSFNEEFYIIFIITFI